MCGFFPPCLFHTRNRQRLWLPKDDPRDSSSSWSSPPLLLLRDIRDIHVKLLTQYDCKDHTNLSPEDVSSFYASRLLCVYLHKFSRASKKIIFEVTTRKVSKTNTLCKLNTSLVQRDCGINCFAGLEKDNFRGHTLKRVNVHFQILIIFWMQLICSRIMQLICSRIIKKGRRLLLLFSFLS
jgi:hypothetical protein